MEPEKTSTQKPPHDGAFMAWGALAGALAGAAIGLVAGHWLFWSMLLGGIGLAIGAVIDRSRR